MQQFGLAGRSNCWSSTFLISLILISHSLILTHNPSAPVDLFICDLRPDLGQRSLLTDKVEAKDMIIQSYDVIS